MKLYYKGKYDLNPESLPHGNHKPGAVMFKEPKDSKTLSLLLTKISLIIIVVLGIIAIIRCKNYLTNSFWQIISGCIAPILIIFPHEILHAICFKGRKPAHPCQCAYLYDALRMHPVHHCIRVLRY